MHGGALLARTISYVALATTVVLLVALDLAAGTPKIRIENAWARPGIAIATKSPAPHAGGMPGGEMRAMPGNSAIYMVIHNASADADRLVGATAAVARTVELHETRIEGGMAQMRKIDGIPVPAKGKVELKPGGLHVMLIGLKRDLKAGETFPVTLKFQRSGEVRLTVRVREP
jgi:copper(I)-binding protein